MSDDLIARLRAFATDCVTHGDMTPAAKRMLERILDDHTALWTPPEGGPGSPVIVEIATTHGVIGTPVRGNP